MSWKNNKDTIPEVIAGTIRDNEKFLLGKNGRTSAVYDEILGLVTVAEKYAKLLIKEGENSEKYNDSCIRPYIFLILRPFSYSIIADLLASNVIACFMEIRLMVESFIKFYYADLKYPKEASFVQKIKLLQDEMRDNQKSMANLIEECGWKNIVKEVRFLWKQLSEGWLHTKGVVEKIVEEVTSKPGIPAWLGAYKPYTEADLSVLEDLRKTVAVFRSVQATVIEHWLDIIPQKEEPQHLLTIRKGD